MEYTVKQIADITNLEKGVVRNRLKAMGINPIFIIAKTYYYPKYALNSVKEQRINEKNNIFASKINF